MKKLAILLTLASALPAAAAVIDFTGPDDLLLDPATSVIAVNTFGTGPGNGVTPDLDVNGVTFVSDGNGAGGSATVGGVTVTTASSHVINNWASAPAYTNGAGASLVNFNNLMHDIRWSATQPPNNAALTIDISGLTSGSLYNVQLLFGENNPSGNGTRTWDISVEGNLEADNITMAGSTTGLGRAFTGNFDPGADGTLSIIMDDDLGGAPNTALDKNPILQGVIIHTIPEPSGVLLGVLGGLVFLSRRRR